MFQEVTIIFTSKNINLSPSYTQFCQGAKKVVVRFPLLLNWQSIGNQKFQWNSLVNCTGYSVDKGTV